MDLINHYQQQFEKLSSSDFPIIKNYRQQAWDRFTHLNFPTTKLEDWKYTSTTALQKLFFSLPEKNEKQLNWDDVVDRFVLTQSKYRLVFLDGFFQPQWSNLIHFPEQVAVRFWDQMNEVQRKTLHLDLQPLHQTDGLSALNGALTTSGYQILVTEDFNLDQPVDVIHISSQPGTASYLSNQVLLGKNSSITLLEQYISLHQEPYLNSSAQQYVLQDGAKLDYIKVQQEGEQGFHLSYMETKQALNSDFHSSYFALSGLWSRNTIATALLGSHAQATINGMYHINHKSFQDFHTSINHQVPDCTSNELFKGVLDGAGRAVFNGKIIVAQDAQRTQSQQANHNLILSDLAEVDTKPQLEILADDVKCAHGTTIGQINEEQWFYLCSRGIDKLAAKKMLVEGFVVDVADQLRNKDLKSAIEKLIREAMNV